MTDHRDGHPHTEQLVDSQPWPQDTREADAPSWRTCENDRRGARSVEHGFRADHPARDIGRRERPILRAPGAACLLGSTAAEVLSVKRHKFPDAHRRPAGQLSDAVRLPVITTRPLQRAHRQKMPHQMLRQLVHI